MHGGFFSNFWPRISTEDFQSGKLPVPPNVADVDWSAKIEEIDASLDQVGRSEANDRELFTLGKCDSRDYNAYLLFSDAAHVSATELPKNSRNQFCR